MVAGIDPLMVTVDPLTVPILFTPVGSCAVKVVPTVLVTLTLGVLVTETLGVLETLTFGVPEIVTVDPDTLSGVEDDTETCPEMLTLPTTPTVDPVTLTGVATLTRRLLDTSTAAGCMSPV